MNEARIQELIESFDHYDGQYKRQEMDEAVALKEEITPHLICILEELAADPVKYDADGHYANTYAVALLAHFQEPKAFMPIVKAFTIADESLDPVWGDMVTGTLPILLFQTCNGELETIKGLVLDRSVNELVRGAAMTALTYAVARGMADRAEMVNLFAGLFTGEEADGYGDFWNDLVCSLLEIHPEGAMDEIRKAYADELVFAGHVGLSEVEQQFLKEKGEVLEMTRARMDKQIPADVHGYLSWFASFNENDRASAPAGSAVKPNKKKDAGRAKSKMAKKSKRKNRK